MSGENENSLYGKVNPNTSNQLYPSLNNPSAPRDIGPPIPVYTCNSQQFRLVEIQKMRDEIEAKIKHNAAKSKRYKNQMIVTEYVNAVLSTVSVISGSSAAITAVPVITVPFIAVPLGAISAVSGVVSGIVLAVSRNRRRKLQDINGLLINEKSTYNAILNYISKAINDSFISDDEFTFISNLYNKDVMNETVKNVDNEINKMAAEIAAVIMAHSVNKK